MFGLQSSNPPPVSFGAAFGGVQQQQQQGKKTTRRRIVQLCRFGAGKELVALFQTFGGKAGPEGRAVVKTLSLDSLEKGAESLHSTAADRLLAFTNDKKELLRTSRELRAMLMRWRDGQSGTGDDDVDMNGPKDGVKRSRKALRTVLSCWRALEIQFLDHETSLRRAIVDWANDFHDDNSVEIVGDFIQGEKLLLCGKGREASAYFKRLVARKTGHLRRFYEGLVMVSAQMPGQDERLNDEHSMSAWVEWRSAVEQLAALLVPGKDDEQIRLVRILSGDHSIIAQYFLSDDGAKRWEGRSWPRFLAVLLLFTAPAAQKHMVGQLASDCADAIRRFERSEQFKSGNQVGDGGLGNEEDDLESARLALNGKALGALQILFNYDAWAVAHMSEIFSRCGAIESPSLFPHHPGQPLISSPFVLPLYNLDFRQIAIFEYAAQLGLGPGRVEERPVDLGWRRIQLAMFYLMFASPYAAHPEEKMRTRCVQVELLARLILDKVPVDSSDSFAREVFELCSTAVPWRTVQKEAQRSIAIRQMEAWLNRGGFVQAVAWANRAKAVEVHSNKRWADDDVDENEISVDDVLLEKALDMFLRKETTIPVGPDADQMVEMVSNNEAVNAAVDVALVLFATKAKLQSATAKKNSMGGDGWLDDYEDACKLLAKVVRRVPLEHRIELLMRVLIDLHPAADAGNEAMTIPAISCEDCLVLMEAVNGLGSFARDEDVVQLNALLSTMLAQGVQAGHLGARRFHL